LLLQETIFVFLSKIIGLPTHPCIHEAPTKRGQGLTFVPVPQREAVRQNASRTNVINVPGAQTI
jgi:hypothetical protein